MKGKIVILEGSAWEIMSQWFDHKVGVWKYDIELIHHKYPITKTIPQVVLDKCLVVDPQTFYPSAE